MVQTAVDQRCVECAKLTVHRCLAGKPLNATFSTCLDEVLKHVEPDGKSRFIPSYVHETLNLLSEDLKRQVSQEIQDNLQNIVMGQKGQVGNDKLHRPERIIDSDMLEYFVHQLYNVASSTLTGIDLATIKGTAQLKEEIEDMADTRIEVRSPELILCNRYSFYSMAHQFIPAYVSAMINMGDHYVKRIDIKRSKRLARWGYMMRKDVQLNIDFAGSHLGYGMRNGEIIAQKAHPPVGTLMAGGKLYVETVSYPNEPWKDDKASRKLIAEKIVSPKYVGGEIHFRLGKKWKMFEKDWKA